MKKETFRGRWEAYEEALKQRYEVEKLYAFTFDCPKCETTKFLITSPSRVKND